MEETKQQPLALRVCAELAGSFLLCFAIYAFSTWGSAVYGINIVFFALATGLAYAAVTAIFSRVSGGQLNPAITVASVLVSKTKILDGILYVIPLGHQFASPPASPLMSSYAHQAGSCQSVADSGR